LDTSSVLSTFIEGLITVATFSEDVGPEFHPVFVLAPPKPDICATLLSAASVVESDPLSHKPSSFGASVSYVSGRKLRDANLGKSLRPGRIQLHAEFEEGNMPEMVVRPLGLASRNEASLPESVEDGLDYESALKRAKVFFRNCIRPVVLFTTKPNEFVEYFAAANSFIDYWPKSEQTIRLSTSMNLDDWFRSPVLIVTPEQARGRDWLSEVEPSIVICVGWRSWRKPARWNWPTAKHVLVLDVRSSDDVELFRGFHDGTEGLSRISEFDNGSGTLTQIIAFKEKTSSPLGDADWDEEIDLD
jgi:hypothetical protein